jgi:hypothetical protein
MILSGRRTLAKLRKINGTKKRLLSKEMEG